MITSFIKYDPAKTNSAVYRVSEITALTGKSITFTNGYTDTITGYKISKNVNSGYTFLEINVSTPGCDQSYQLSTGDSNAFRVHSFKISK